MTPKKRKRREKGSGKHPLHGFRMDPDEYRELVAAAELLMIPVSQFIRETCLRRARRIIREHEQ